ncbi:C-type lectin domain family 17, member A isoform X1 [Panthera uncia]|uniref:C-type lectin domain family 17, member A isoform X1 n=1 Tax=Panthera uncia TaxID=29064 RepID=UPI0020FF818F|nr:C-type lectin domain family 17, member A isoform X1 [Panthera uncia]
MAMITRTWHPRTRISLPSQTRWPHLGLQGQERKQRTPHCLASPQRSKVWTSPQSSAHLLHWVSIQNAPPFQPSLAATPGSQLSQKSRCPGCYQEERLVVFLCLLVVVSLLLGCTGLAVTLIKYQEVVGELRMLTFQQTAWQASVTGTAGLAGLKKDIDHIRTNTNQSLVELRGLLDCTRITCPEDWLPFEGKCYYFSPRTKSWDEARKFCQENYSHLVIINSFAEQKFVAKAHGSPRIYWLGLSDRDYEGDWKWLDGSPVTLSFWDPEEPNNINDEDCASMNKGGTWNDLSCDKTTYWICERKCSC